VAARVVVLVSGAGTNLQALIEAAEHPAYGAEVVAVGADRDGTRALARAERSGVPTFVLRLGDYPDRDAWDRALADTVTKYEPDLVVSAGFLKLVGPAFLSRFGGRFINSHPALLPSFPGMHGPRDALAYGVTITGVTIFMVDSGVDTGPIVAQAAVPVARHDTEATLHERIKSVERTLLVETVGRMVREGYHTEGRRVLIP
jgi:phosphoribosylglycinamide formyltransferase 1